MTSGGYAIRRPGMRGRKRAPELATGSQRALFTLALLTFFLASSYTGVALLARVTPALFPGRALTDLPVVAAINKVVSVPEASANGSFRDPIHILVLGLDRRPSYDNDGNVLPIPDDANGGFNTDVFMVVSVDPVTKKTTLLSFPRDMWVDINPKDGPVTEGRINTSYGVGVRAGGSRSAGIEQVKRDLKADFNIGIDYSMVIDFKGVEGLVNALGGITVDIPAELSIDSWYYSDDDRHAQYLSFPPGIQQLDGYHAVAFGRYRSTDSDLERIKRQQLVVKAAVAKTFSSGIASKNPLDLYNAYNSLLKTDVPTGAMPGLGDVINQTNGSMQTFSLGDPVDDVPTMIPFTTDGGAAVLKWNPENVQYWLARAFPVTRHADAVVELQNAYGDPAQGNSRVAALGRFLVYSKGLVTVYYGADQPPQPKTTIILTRDAQRKAAEDIADWMGLSRDRIVSQPVDASDTATPDIEIVVGHDFVIPGTR
jgi:LCP family protein required for cell wall assembly